MMDDFFALRDFTGRSAYHSMGPFPFFICTLHILHAHSLHCFIFLWWGDSYDGRFFCIARFHGKIGISQHGAISILHLHFAHSARTQSSLFHFSSLGFQLFFVNRFFSVFTFELSFYFRTFFFRVNCGDTETNKLTAPYRENYVHRILFFYVRISLTSNDQGPAGPDPAGGPARPVQ